MSQAHVVANEDLFPKLVEKIFDPAQTSDEDLMSIWAALDNYDPAEFYDSAKTISMDEWANLIYGALSDRGLCEEAAKRVAQRREEVDAPSW